MSYRIDRTGGVKGTRRTTQGGLIVDAFLTRTGVLNYQQPDGSTVRELRPPEEVFREDSLATLTNAPLVVGHPAGGVNPGNWRELAVGHVDGEVTYTPKYVRADLRIMDQSTIDKVESKQIVELSCGYRCDVEQTGGEWQGERYDAIQRSIVYDHVAAGPVNWGRAGNEVRIRMDGLTLVIDERADDLLAQIKVLNPEVYSQVRGRNAEYLSGVLTFLTTPKFDFGRPWR